MLSPPENILVIIVARVGDTLLSTPVMHALRKACPKANIEVLAHPKRKAVLENNPDIDKLLSYGFFSGVLNRKIYDLAIVIGDDRKLIRYARAKAGKVIGFEQKDPALNRPLDVSVIKPKGTLHAVDECLLLVKTMGLNAPERRLIYEVSAPERRWAEAFLRKCGIDDACIRIGFQMSGFPTKAYRDLPSGHFISLGRMILRDLNAKILLFGDRKDIKKTKDIQTSLGKDNVAVIPGKIDLRRYAAALSLCSAFVTTDTGPMHIAFAMNVPTVAMFHCMQSGDKLGPSVNAHLHRVIQMEPPPGTECNRKMGMETISPETIYSNLKIVLEGGHGRAC